VRALPFGSRSPAYAIPRGDGIKILRIIVLESIIFGDIISGGVVSIQRDGQQSQSAR
jgi:hypothetical protein